MLQPPRTFCNVPFCDDIGTFRVDDSGAGAASAGANRPGAIDVAIIGAPHGTPYEPGVASHAANAPQAIREALGWFSVDPDQLDFDTGERVFGGCTIVDCGDVAGDLSDGAANRRGIEAASRAVLDRGAVPILLGGDDSTPIPLLAAYEGRGPITIVQIDAHIDWRHEREGVTHGYSSTMRRASEYPWVTTIIQVGARGPGSARSGELADAKEWGVHFFSGREVHTAGVGAAIAAVPKGAPVFLAIDVDGIDPSVVPGVILPAFGGLTYQQMLDVILGVAGRGRIVGADFVEYVPERDPTGIGAQAIARLASVVVTAIARQRRGDHRAS